MGHLKFKVGEITAVIGGLAVQSPPKLVRGISEAVRPTDVSITVVALGDRGIPLVNFGKHTVDGGDNAVDFRLEVLKFTPMLPVVSMTSARSSCVGR